MHQPQHVIQRDRLLQLQRPDRLLQLPRRDNLLQLQRLRQQLSTITCVTIARACIRRRSIMIWRQYANVAI